MVSSIHIDQGPRLLIGITSRKSYIIIFLFLLETIAMGLKTKERRDIITDDEDQLALGFYRVRLKIRGLMNPR